MANDHSEGEDVKSYTRTAALLEPQLQINSELRADMFEQEKKLANVAALLSDQHHVCCNYRNQPIGGPGCICVVSYRRLEEEHVKLEADNAALRESLQFWFSHNTTHSERCTCVNCDLANALLEKQEKGK